MSLRSFSKEDWKELEEYIEGQKEPGGLRLINWKLLVKKFLEDHSQNIGPISNQLILSFQIPFKNIPIEIGKSSGIVKKVFSFRLEKGF